MSKRVKDKISTDEGKLLTLIKKPRRKAAPAVAEKLSDEKTVKDENFNIKRAEQLEDAVALY